MRALLPPLLAALLPLGFATAHAQEFQAPEQPAVPLRDENFVTMPADYVSVSAPVLSIGGAEPLSLAIVNYASGYEAGGRPISCEHTIGTNCQKEPYLRSGFYPAYNLQTSLEGGLKLPQPWTWENPAKWVFSFGGINEVFGGGTSGSEFPRTIDSLTEEGGELLQLSNYEFRYTDRHGAVYHLGGDEFIQVSGFDIPVVKVEYPNGRVLDITYKVLPNSGGRARLQDVRDNYGFFIHFEYDADTYSASNPQASRWIRRSHAGNLAVETCAAQSVSCALTNPRSAQNHWDIESTILEVGTPTGEKTTYTQNYYWEITSVTPVGHETPYVTYELCGRVSGSLCTGMTNTENIYSPGVGPGVSWMIFPGMVHRAFRGGETTQYASTQNLGGYLLQTTFTNDYRGQRILTQRSHPHDSSLRGQFYGYQHFGGLHFSYSGDHKNRLVGFSKNGISTTFQYDYRGNITSKTETSSDGEMVRSQTYVYPATCQNIVICNKPTQVTDAELNTTDITYDPVHGGVTSVIGPPNQGGMRPQTRYQYEQRSARFKDANGLLVDSPHPVWLLVSESFCRTSEWNGVQCGAGASDEVITSYDYGSSAGANNLLLRSVTISADGETSKACFSYNTFGEKTGETLPNANLAGCA